MTNSWEVELGAGEHRCCGEEIVLDAVVRLRARRVGEPAVLVGHRHPAERDWDMVIVEGRVADVVALAGPGAERVPVVRLPGGTALRGSDPADDGLLLSAVDEEPLATEPDHFVVTVVGTCCPEVPPDPHSRASTPGWW